MMFVIGFLFLCIFICKFFYCVFRNFSVCENSSGCSVLVLVIRKCNNNNNNNNYYY